MLNFMLILKQLKKFIKCSLKKESENLNTELEKLIVYLIFVIVHNSAFLKNKCMAPTGFYPVK
jgi:hypothetical protein